MRALVLDQSTTTVGWAVVEEDPTASFYPGFTGRLLAHGRTTTPASASVVDRLMVIKIDIQILINTHKPQELVIENTTFKQKSGATSNAMGAIYIACQELAHVNRLKFYTQNPTTIKSCLTGKGNASKDDVKNAVCQYFGIPRYKIKDDNHSDALGAAFVWLYRGAEVREKATEKKRGRHVSS